MQHYILRQPRNTFYTRLAMQYSIEKDILICTLLTKTIIEKRQTLGFGLGWGIFPARKGHVGFLGHVSQAVIC